MSNSWHNVEDNVQKDDANALNQQPAPASNANPQVQQNTIDNINSFYSTSTETWYPAAGNQLANEVDEPNQQGLTKYDDNNGTENLQINVASLIFMVVLTIFW